MKNKLLHIYLVLALLLTHYSFGQVDSLSDSQKAKRERSVWIATVATYGLSIIGMHQLWYKNQETTSWHFFNDNSEWLQVDKVGHFYTAFHLSRAYYNIFQWSGLDNEKSAWYAGIVGFGYMTTIEILDGFQKEYGASWGDLAANTIGSFGIISQQLAWGEIRIMPKFSYHNSPYAYERPNTLGSNWNERILKDYNGQTYWLSFDVYSFIKQSKFPKWLNIAAGYGANSMIFGNQENNIQSGLTPYRQFYLGLDFDFSHMETKSKFLNTCLDFLSCIKLPAPTMEWNKEKGMIFHPIYF